jgi:hypothetical protein
VRSFDEDEKAQKDEGKEQKDREKENEKETNKQKDVRVSELAALGNDRLLVLERTDKRARVYGIVLDGKPTNILGKKWDDRDTEPTLEALEDLKSENIQPVTKTRPPLVDTDCLEGAPNKIEGMTLLDDGSLFLINDNDFGIRGDATKAMIVKDKIKPAGPGETP